MINLEQEYIVSVSLEHRKKFAQFFTPERIASFMCGWVMQGKNKKKALEPAYGLGIFSRILTHSHNLSVDAYEIDEKIFSYAMPKCPDRVKLVNEDYFISDWNTKYDVIVCNPPYLKFHDYDNSAYITDVNHHIGAKLSGFTNLYTLFLLKSIAQLQEGGRLAYIVPSEFLNSDYGVEVKRALIRSNALRHIVIIDFTKCAFDNAITTACIILCENTKFDKIRFSTIKNIESLDECLGEYLEYDVNDIDVGIKWKVYYEKCCGCKYSNLVPFSNFARVSRGIATGANNYFTFNQSKVDDFNIPEISLVPCICKSYDAPKIFFTQNDFEALVNRDRTVFLFNGCLSSDDINVARYIRLGEEIGVNKRFLTSSRNPWYLIENRPPAPIWVSVFNRGGLRFVRNEAGVNNLTTFHCVYPNDGVDTDVLFAYLITDVAKRIFMDNSRQYGNGLVKFEPNDLNKGNVVDLSRLTWEEIKFIKETYDYIRQSQDDKKGVALLNNFFENKYTNGLVQLRNSFTELQQLKNTVAVTPTQIKVPRRRTKQLNFFSIYDQYGENSLVDNSILREEANEYNIENRNYELVLQNSVLVSLVKDNYIEQYSSCISGMYYTCKRFPSNIALNKLCYFMPYVKDKGIRDIYFIKDIRLSLSNEIGNDKSEFLMVFEIEYIRRLFGSYKNIDLKIWNEFTNVTLKEIIEQM